MEEKFDYNSIPVEFCAKATCCSLAIVEDEDGVYCKDCGGLKTTKAHIDSWKHYYFMAHGKYFV